MLNSSCICLIHLVVVDEDSRSILGLQMELSLLGVYDSLGLSMSLCLCSLVGQSCETSDLAHESTIGLSRITRNRYTVLLLVSLSYSSIRYIYAIASCTATADDLGSNRT